MLELIPETGAVSFIVEDTKGEYAGLVTLDEIKAALLDPGAVPLLVVRDVLRSGIPQVRMTDDLATVLETFARFGIDHLPVVPTDHGRGVTMISRAALLKVYQRELAQRS